MKKIRPILASLMLLLILLNLSVVDGISRTTAPSKIRIAVVGLGAPAYNEPTIRQYLGESLTNELVEANMFTVIDRMRTEQVMEEQIKGQLGGVDAATAARMAGILGVQFLVMITPMELKEEKGTCVGMWGIQACSTVAKVAINIQSINAESAEVAFSKRIEASHTSGGVTFQKDKVEGGMKSAAMNKAVDKAMKNAAKALAERLLTFEAVPTNRPAPIPAAEMLPSIGRAVPNHLKAKRIMVVVPETFQKRVTNHPSGETEIIRQLVENGLTVVDQSQINTIRNREIVLAAVKNDRAAVNLALEFGASIIVIGDLVGESLEKNGNTASVRVRLEAKAIQADNGRILFAGGKTASGIDVTESIAASNAFQKVGSAWAVDLLGKLLAAPSEPSGKSNVNKAASTIEVLMSNSDFTQMRLLAEAIGRTPGVGKITKSLTGNIARLLVEFDGSADALAETIEKTQIGGERVKIISFTDGKIDVEIGQVVPEIKQKVRKRKQKVRKRK